LKATRGRLVSEVILVASVVLLVATLLLPTMKEPQMVRVEVPPSTDLQGSRVFGYGIPTVDNGSVINATLSGYKPEDVEYYLSPTVGNTVLTALVIGKVGSGPTSSFFVNAHGTYSLELTIIAYNGSGFALSYSATWSPYSTLNVYVTPGVFLVAASLASTYYYGTRIERQHNEERVQKELEESRKAKESQPR